MLLIVIISLYRTRICVGSWI